MEKINICGKEIIDQPRIKRRASHGMQKLQSCRKALYTHAEKQTELRLNSFSLME